jgi:hypothetical protein
MQQSSDVFEGKFYHFLINGFRKYDKVYFTPSKFGPSPDNPIN